MKTVGIVCEYNPFHRGHGRQLSLLREQYPEAALVCLMSGRFVQRGEPAVYAPSVRAGAALLAGADLVLELPVTVSIRSAEGFAAGAVEILTRLGTEGLSFGTESPAGHREAARVLLQPELSLALRPYLDQGLSFPAARSRAAAELGADPGVLTRPNDILGVEYCKAILSQGSPMTPLPLCRPGDYHAREADRENPSATSLRERIFRGESLEGFVSHPEVYRGAVPHSLAYGERAVLARLRTMDEAAFQALPYGSEGLWRKLRRACLEEATLEGILEAAKSRRYTRTRLARMLLCAYLGITREELEAPAPYVRVLGFGPRGRALLRGRDWLQNLGKRMEHPRQAREDQWRDLYDLTAKALPAPRTRERVTVL